MVNYYSVNEMLDQIQRLHGEPVEVEGILEALSGEIDGYELLHYPKVERRGGVGKTQTHYSSVWLHFGTGSIQPNRSVLAKWVGKRVRVHGVANCRETSQPRLVALSDPLAMCPAHIEVYSVQRVTTEQRKSGDA